MRPLTALLVTLFAPGLVPAAEVAPPPRPAEVPAAIRGGLKYLQDYGTTWMESRKCASCHHLPQLVWTLAEAKAAGYRIDDKALADVTAYLAAADNRAKILPDPNDKSPGNQSVSGGVVYSLLALGALPAPDPAARAVQARMVKHVLGKQEKDGSWAEGVIGPMPPVFDAKGSATALVALSLAAPGTDPKDMAAAKEAWAKAAKWLGEQPGDAAELQFHVLRLWVWVKAGDAAGVKASVPVILALQRPDGGWAQTKDAASDAWATGQTLYVLSLAGVKSADPAITRGQAFLVKTQLADGSWLMKSRPRSNAPKGAKNLEPITYAASAWATLGLIRSSRSAP